MGRRVAIGVQDFATLREKQLYYVDKTYFIKDWWERGDTVTLLCRPRRFGKTLTMSMLEAFFSNRCENRGDLFEGLQIWKEEPYRKLQGTYPVINLTFSAVKETNFQAAKGTIGYLLRRLYIEHAYLLDSKVLTKGEREIAEAYCSRIPEQELKSAVDFLSGLLHRHYGKKVLILLDEYDTPMQEAFHYGYWDQMIEFMRVFFNFTFKMNTHMERALMTGITRIGHENLFSDFNNPRIVTATSKIYETAVGFTEAEVFSGMEEQGIPADQRDKVRSWYDGFVFGSHSGMYNPWSIINYFANKQFDTYWANTSSNGLVAGLMDPKDETQREAFKNLLKGDSIEVYLDEQIVFADLHRHPEAVWSMLYASGYLKATEVYLDEGRYVLEITNGETYRMFGKMVHRWLAAYARQYNEFQRALLMGDVTKMNTYLSLILRGNTSFFDGGKKPSKKEPERFYHGLILGLIVDLKDKYEIVSNGESGFGRYDIMLRPKDAKNAPGIIMEFKVLDEGQGEKTLADAAQSALKQIEQCRYDEKLLSAGVPREHIRTYGFAFEGKRVLIEEAQRG